MKIHLAKKGYYLVPTDQDSYRKLMQIKAGYFKMYKTKKGSYIESDSIAFDKMTEEEFNKLYAGVKMQVAKDIGVTSDELELQILEQF
jgi:hypothetical protein